MGKMGARMAYSVDKLCDRYAGKVSIKPALDALPLPKGIQRTN